MTNGKIERLGEEDAREGRESCIPLGGGGPQTPTHNPHPFLFALLPHAQFSSYQSHITLAILIALIVSTLPSKMALNDHPTQGSYFKIIYYMHFEPIFSFNIPTKCAVQCI
jgi:hypothetical protein